MVAFPGATPVITPFLFIVAIFLSLDAHLTEVEFMPYKFIANLFPCGISALVFDNLIFEAAFFMELIIYLLKLNFFLQNKASLLLQNTL